MGRTTGYLTKEYTATAGILARRICKWGAADGAVVTAVDGAAECVGVTSELDAAAGDYASVFRVGNIAEVVFGGAVTRGDPLTADAQGRAVTAAPGAGVNINVVGHAECSGVLGDIGTVTVQPFRMQG